MDNYIDRLEKVKVCAEERSQLQSSCFNDLELEGCDSSKEIGKLRYLYEKCLIENTSKYACLNQRQEILKGNL